MADAVILPKMGQTVEEASIVKWHKSEGDGVAKGDILFEIETDKAVLEVESFYAGTLLKVLVQENVVVPVSTTVAFIGEKGEKVPDSVPAPVAAQAPVEVEKPVEARTPQAEERKFVPVQAAALAPAAPTPVAPVAPVAPPVAARVFISPRARALARRMVINPNVIRGTGPNGRIVGRIVEKDVLSYLDTMEYHKLRISPAAKKLAAVEKIDILTLRAEGGGRIMVGDVKRRLAERPKPMSKMRRIISKRLSESFREVPHFYATVSVDMTDLLIFRKELKDSGAVYSVTDFILEAVIMSLQEFPPLNSSTDGESVSWKGNVDLGMAVGLDEGLVVPVIRNAAELNMGELHDVVKDLAARARSGKLLPDEMTGSSFTVSNMGMLDVDNFNAIINPGESAILAVASTRETPVVVDGKVVVRSIMKITLSVDHRIVDGVTGVLFANAVKAKLEDPELWKMLT